MSVVGRLQRIPVNMFLVSQKQTVSARRSKLQFKFDPSELALGGPMLDSRRMMAVFTLSVSREWLNDSGQWLRNADDSLRPLLRIMELTTSSSAQAVTVTDVIY